MSITGKKINAAIEIMKITMAANDVKPTTVAAVIHYSDKVAILLTNNTIDAANMAKAIVERMVTITVEAK